MAINATVQTSTHAETQIYYGIPAGARALLESFKQ